MSSDIDAARAQFTAEELAVLDSHLAQKPLPAEAAGLVQRLQHAIEGECGGLAISEAQALAILHYALEPPAPPVAPARWVLVSPQGEVMCEPQQYPSQAWAVLRGTYKTTLEGILGYEQAGWTVAAALPQAAAQVVPPKTWFHDAGAQAQCHYCKRYSLDPRTLSDRPPACECGEKLGWSGSFKPPGPEARWSGATPQAEAAAGVPPPTVPPNIVRYTDRFIEVLLAIHGPVSDDLSDSARLACAQVITELLAAQVPAAAPEEPDRV